MTSGIVLIFMFPIDMVFPLLVLFVSLLLIRKQLTSLFVKMPCQLSFMPYTARVLGRLYHCFLMLFLSPASGYTRLKPKLMALLRGIKLV
jgi:hypothetical protein